MIALSQNDSLISRRPLNEYSHNDYTLDEEVDADELGPPQEYNEELNGSLSLPMAKAPKWVSPNRNTGVAQHSIDEIDALKIIPQMSSGGKPPLVPHTHQHSTSINTPQDPNRAPDNESSMSIDLGPTISVYNKNCSQKLK